MSNKFHCQGNVLSKKGNGEKIGFWLGLLVRLFYIFNIDWFNIPEATPKVYSQIINRNNLPIKDRLTIL